MRDTIQLRGLMIDDALEDLDEDEIIMVLEESSRLPVVLKERLSGQRWERLKQRVQAARDEHRDGRNQGRGLWLSQLLEVMEDLEKNPSCPIILP